MTRVPNSAFFKIADGYGGHTQVLALFDRSRFVSGECFDFVKEIPVMPFGVLSPIPAMAVALTDFSANDFCL
jgi:hypothetical protein